MIGLDTNVIVRYLVQDEPGQAAQATSLMESLTETEPGFVSIVTAVELSWVLTRAYHVERDALADIVEGLLASRELVLQHAEVVREGVGGLREGADFADVVIAELDRAAGCAHTVTFDRRAIQRSGMVMID